MLSVVWSKNGNFSIHNYEDNVEILPRLKTRESYGTAPLDWDISVCSLPLAPSVRIRWTSPEGRLRAVPASRYSYFCSFATLTGRYAGVQSANWTVLINTQFFSMRL